MGIKKIGTLPTFAIETNVRNSFKEKLSQKN